MLNYLRNTMRRLPLRLRYLLWQRRRHGRLVLERVAGRDLVVLPSVMNPHIFRTGAFLVEQLNEALVAPGSRVLDMGTGSGIAALVAAEWAREVLAVDINPAAVRCARMNVLLNEVEERVTVLQGDLFAPVANERFDVVLFNPPYFRGQPEDGFDYAWRSENTVERFVAALPRHLAPGAHTLLVLSSDGDAPAFLRCFAHNGFRQDVVASRRMGPETLTVYRFTLERASQKATQSEEEPCPA
jgi:release factor glutamine methyltransferase